MQSAANPELELDSGGFGRLDISDLTDREHEEASPLRKPCDWCTESRSSEEYLVVADNRHFLLCPLCWGRSAAYVELRRDGIPHDAALIKLVTS